MACIINQQTAYWPITLFPFDTCCWSQCHWPTHSINISENSLAAFLPFLYTFIYYYTCTCICRLLWYYLNFYCFYEGTASQPHTHIHTHTHTHRPDNQQTNLPIMHYTRLLYPITWPTSSLILMFFPFATLRHTMTIMFLRHVYIPIINICVLYFYCFLSFVFLV